MSALADPIKSGIREYSEDRPPERGGSLVRKFGGWLGGESPRGGAISVRGPLSHSVTPRDSHLCRLPLPGRCPSFAPTPLRYIFAPSCHRLALAICPSRCPGFNTIHAHQVFSQFNMSSTHVSKTNSQQHPQTSSAALPLPVRTQHPPTVRNLVPYNRSIFRSEYSHIHHVVLECILYSQVRRIYPKEIQGDTNCIFNGVSFGWGKSPESATASNERPKPLPSS